MLNFPLNFPFFKSHFLFLWCKALIFLSHLHKTVELYIPVTGKYNTTTALGSSKQIYQSYLYFVNCSTVKQAMTGVFHTYT